MQCNLLYCSASSATCYNVHAVMQHVMESTRYNMQRATCIMQQAESLSLHITCNLHRTTGEMNTQHAYTQLVSRFQACLVLVHVASLQFCIAASLHRCIAASLQYCIAT